jgi:hypothetical protein
MRERFMDFNDLSDKELLDSILPEVAKALNEVRHAQDDLDKANSRLRFIIAVVNNLKIRDQKE